MIVCRARLASENKPALDPPPSGRCASIPYAIPIVIYRIPLTMLFQIEH